MPGELIPTIGIYVIIIQISKRSIVLVYPWVDSVPRLNISNTIQRGMSLMFLGTSPVS